MTEHHLEFLRLEEGYTGSSGSALVKMPHCWKSHAVINYYVFVVILIDINQSVKQLGSRSGPAIYWVLFGSKMFEKVISKR